MGYAIFGHGGFSPDPAAKMEWCALGKGTTLQYFADIGQALWQQRRLLDMFGALDRPWPPIDDTGVTYNLYLQPLSEAELANLTSAVQDWGGHTLLTIGTDIGCEPQLCTGDETTCPKDPRMITGAKPGPTEHGCDGILAKYAGEELFWVACTSTIGFDPDTQDVVDSARGEAPSAVLLGTNPDDAVANALALAGSDPVFFTTWFDGLGQEEKDVLLADPGIYAWDQGRGSVTEWNPSKDDLAKVATQNQEFVKSLDEDVDAAWAIGGFALLLGDNHGYGDWLQTQQDYASGTFQVRRATFGAGKLVFTGVPPVHEGTITSAIEQFSDKAVKFE